VEALSGCGYIVTRRSQQTQRQVVDAARGPGDRAPAMLQLTHWLFVLLYVLAPVAAFALSFLRRRGNYRFDRSYLLTWVAGIAFAVGLNVIYAMAAGAKVLPSQVLLASYLGAGMLFILKGFDSVLARVVSRIYRVGPYSKGSSRLRRTRLTLAAVTRSAILIVTVLPYVMASVMTYRPKVQIIDDPIVQFGQPYQTVQFPATDGAEVSGWWMPSPAGVGHSDKTVIVCHGLGANKSNQLFMTRSFLDAGYNVLIFDFRAHGGSAGHLSSFGDDERYDVLGAVRWLIAAQPKQCRRIFGVGASMGAAALIAAAAEDSVEGRAFHAIAVYGTYDDLGQLTQDISRQYFIPPFSWLLPNIGLPLASAQCGRNLANFHPADLISRVWPRPVMVIHGVKDEIIPFDRGKRLFQSADQPKRRLWLTSGDHNKILHDRDAAGEVLEFFESAEPQSVL